MSTTPDRPPVNKNPVKKDIKKIRFVDEINRVCKEHKFQFKPILTYTAEGVFPNINIVPIEEPTEEVKPNGTKAS